MQVLSSRMDYERQGNLTKGVLDVEIQDSRRRLFYARHLDTNGHIPGLQSLASLHWIDPPGKEHGETAVRHMETCRVICSTKNVQIAIFHKLKLRIQTHSSSTFRPLLINHKAKPPILRRFLAKIHQHCGGWATLHRLVVVEASYTVIGAKAAVGLFPDESI
jgi:hypothetical protein